MSARQFRMWGAFLGLEPPLGDRLDVHMARQLWAAVEPKRDPKKRRQPFEPEDFLPSWGGVTGKPKKQQDWRVMKARLMGHLRTAGGAKK